MNNNYYYRKDEFLISKTKLNFIPSNFSEIIKLQFGYFYFDSETNITIYEGESKLILVGYILDIRNHKLNAQDILKELDLSFSNSLETFYNNLEFLNGRFFIILDNQNDSQIYTDATSLKPIYYWNNSIFGSHEILVKNTVEENEQIKLKTRWTNGYMDYTGTESIFKFNCNNFFSLNDKAFERYFPRGKIEIQDAEIILDKTFRFLEEQVKWLSILNKKLYLSLTGGIDSKVSLSLLKPLKNKIDLFTYLIDFENSPAGPRKDIYTKDKEIVDRLVYNFDLRHKFYRFQDLEIPSNFIEDMKRNFSSAHSNEVAFLVREYMDKGSIHIKSNIYELAKFPYPKSVYSLSKIEQGHSITRKWLPKSIRKNRENSKKLYLESVQRTNLTRENIFNCNLGVILYLESKLSNWHSNITQETDEIQETFILFNSKFLIRNLLSLNLEDRVNNKLLNSYINRAWPFLNYQMANSYNTLEVFKDNQVSVFCQGDISILHPFNVEIAFDTNLISIKPSSNVDLKDKEISFILKNNSNNDVKIKIKSNYKHKQKNIFIDIESTNFSINDFFSGKEVILSSKHEKKVSISYIKNFKFKSWYDAGELIIQTN